MEVLHHLVDFFVHLDHHVSYISAQYSLFLACRTLIF